MEILDIFVFTVMLGSVSVHGFGAPSPNCGSQVGCIFHPPGCNADASCKMTLMYWKVKSQDKVMFEARAEGSWVGVGLSDDHFMIGTTGEICKCQGSSCSINGFAANSQQRPPLMIHPMGVEVTSISQNNGQIFCNFKRSINPMSGYMKDLNEAYHFVMAAGSVSGGLIQQHDTSMRFTTALKLLAEEFTEDDSSLDTNTVLAITLPLAILIVLLILGFIVYYYSRKRSKRSSPARHVDGYSAGWKYPNRLEPYGYSYRQNPEIYNYSPRTLDNYSDEVYRKYQPAYVNEGHQGDPHLQTPKQKRIDPNAQPFNRYFKDAKHKSGPEHDVYF